MRRRRFVATAAGLGTAALAGCSGGGGGSGGSDDGTDTGGDSDSDGGGGGGGTTLGTFRLLVSDQPAAIGDFDSLTVTLSSARVFRADEDETVTPSAVNATATATTTDTESDGDEEEDGDEDDEGRGFVEFDLGGVAVDLTQVVGDRAVSVLEGELEAGRYSGIELRVETAEGVVDGDAVDVMVPSDRLRIVRPFEIAADAELAFVFDINVVQKGPRGGYNLLPVIGESGVVGEGVEVEEVDADADDGADDDSTATPESDSTETSDGDSTATPTEGSDMDDGGSNRTGY